MDYQKKWSQCLELIRHELSSQAFDTWFSSISVLSVENKEITIQVPNRFHYEWLDSKYDAILKGVLKKSFGQSMIIKYSVVINTETQTHSVVPDNKPL